MGEGVMENMRGKVQELSLAALSEAAIAKKLGISKQRVSQILHPRPKKEKPSLDSKIMLRTGDAAQFLGVHVNTVRRWSEKGMLRTYRLGTRSDRRFRREDLEKFLGRGAPL